MEDFKQRLISEQEELDNKLNKLLSFIESDSVAKVPQVQQNLLFKQVKVMDEYNNILKERIYHLSDYKKELIQSFLKKECKFGVSNGQIYFSTTMDKATLFFNENGFDFFDVWNDLSGKEQDKIMQNCFIVQ